MKRITTKKSYKCVVGVCGTNHTQKWQKDLTFILMILPFNYGLGWGLLMAAQNSLRKEKTMIALPLPRSLADYGERSTAMQIWSES